MEITEAWSGLGEALGVAVGSVVDDPGPLNQRELADGHQYVVRILAAVAESALLTFDPERPAFLPMLESVRYLGASGPDIDYDVAIVAPGVPHRITGTRGEATFVGITLYAHAGEKGASGIVGSVDVDDVAAEDGSFTYEFDHPEAARVIVRQYFHDRARQARGSWTIERSRASAATSPVPGGEELPTVAALAGRVANAAQSLRWNARLNRLWSPDLRATPNCFVRQTPEEIVAAVTNPDVTYSFTWWELGEGEALVIDVVPPETDYWALQLCDRWFQCQPGRRTNLNDRQVTPAADGSVRLVLSDGDPGHPHWLDTSGHRTGVVFFRWLHADPSAQPACRVVPAAEVAGL